MLWKLVANWQQRRTVDSLGLGWHCDVASRQRSYYYDDAAETTLSLGARTLAVLLTKRGNIPKRSVPPHGSKSNKRHLTSLDLKAKVTRLGDGWQVSSRSTDSLDCLLWKWSHSRSALPTDSHTSPALPPTSGGNGELTPNITDFRVDRHLEGTERSLANPCFRH